jgi:ABC-type multidrug transport system ATPase subunit
MPSVVRVKNVFKSFDGVRALQGVSFEVPRKSIFGLLGRNGAGKTTLLRILGTTLQPDSGVCEVEGFDVVRDPMEVRARIGILPERYGEIRGGWTLWDYLKYFGTLTGPPADSDAKRLEVLEQVGLVEARHRPLATLSAGMRKRAEIARLLLEEPSVLLLDEPGKELDILGKEELWQWLLDYVAEGATVLLTSHDPTEVAALCDRVCVLRDGKKTYEGDASIPQRPGIKVPSSLFRKVRDALEECPVKVTTLELGEWILLSPSEGAGLAALLGWLRSKGIAEQQARLSSAGGLVRYL